GFRTAVDKSLLLSCASLGHLDQLLHVTTTATNAILEGKGAAAALLITKGFHYVLEIGRHDIPRHANMFAWVKPSRPVAPELIFGIGGGPGVSGGQLRAPDGAAVADAARARPQAR